MFLKRKFEILLLIFFLLFSIWLFNKSFGYNTEQNSFRIARHQIGDFGLHLSLIRSFSWGNNYFPVESPFFPGFSLPYHYYFDFLVGLLEKIGFRIDIAFNGLSVLFFTALLYFIYKLPQVIFYKSRVIGIISVVLFVFHSNLTFIDFLREKGISKNLFLDLWLLPDYLNKGPFDGSIISLFFTLNVYLNQRHFIAGLTISMFIFFIFLSKIINNKNISYEKVILLGFLLGLISRFHTLTFFSTSIVLFTLLLIFKHFRFILPFFAPAALLFFFHANDILLQNMQHLFFNPGFLSQKPLSFYNFVYFWLANIGISLFLIPIAVWLSKKKHKIIFLSFFPLFIIGNIFQLSFRIDHNHSIFNFFFIFANFYIAYLLTTFLLNTNIKRFVFVILMFLLTISGVIDIFAIKNDFQFYLEDAPKNRLMKWIRTNTNKNDIFLSRQEILDSVTLSGRKNFLGHDYYLSVMGYDYYPRLVRVKTYFEANSQDMLEKMRKESITYIVIPNESAADFNYIVNKDFFRKNLPVVYEDKANVVYKL